MPPLDFYQADPAPVVFTSPVEQPPLGLMPALTAYLTSLNIERERGVAASLRFLQSWHAAIKLHQADRPKR